MANIIAVGSGGALGSIFRYIISLIPYKCTFPLLTLVTNICGAILIGYITGIALKKDISIYTILFLKTGLCGGFTTFSTFSIEAYNLFQNEHYAYTILYVLLSFFGCFMGVYIGNKLA